MPGVLVINSTRKVEINSGNHSSNIGADRALFSGRRRTAQGRRNIKNSGRRIIKNSGRRIIINIRHNYMHDVTRSKSGGVRRNEEE